MKNQLHPIDKFVLKNLEGNKIEPSEKVWTGLEKKFLNGRDYHSSSLKTNWLLFLLMGFSVISLTAILTLNTTPIADNPFATTSTPGSPEHLTTDLLPATHKRSASEAPIENKTPDARNLIINPELTELRASTRENKAKLPPLLMLPLSIKQLSQPDIPYPTANTEYAVKLAKLHSPDYFRLTDFYTGIHFSPGITHYPASNSNRNNYDIEVSAGHEHQRFFIQSGLGVGYFSEKGNTSIAYKSYDSIGYYYDIRSFQIHPEYPDSVIFELKMTGIYDSIEHALIKRTTNQYFYLQIPLNIGYKIWQKNRISFTIRGGIIFSWLIYKDEPRVRFTASDATLIKNENQYPGRTRTNWQWMAGIGMHYELSNRMQFSVEPFFRQYFQNVYLNGQGYNSRMPYTIGLKTGIYLNY